MKTEPKIGLEFERTFVVSDSHLITFADDRMPAVLSTPMLIAEMEYTARDSVADLLDEDERTVGTAVDIKHLAPSLPGMEVRCRSRVIQVEGNEIAFAVVASDAVDVLARGVHRRHVVNVDRLRRRVERKQQANRGLS